MRRLIGIALAICPAVFLAHLPAGYLLTLRVARRPSPGLLRLGLLASILPDLDLVRFYLFDHGRVLHHAYWTHEPRWWALLAFLWFGAARLRRSRSWMLGGSVFFGNVFAHLVLDTVTGGIRWLAPFSERSVQVFSVPAGHAWWVSNFLLHWTFLLELAVIVCAIRELWRRRSSARPRPRLATCSSSPALDTEQPPHGSGAALVSSPRSGSRPA